MTAPPSAGRRWVLGIALGLPLLSGCGPKPPPATVEGTLRLNGQPMDNCLVTFVPEAGADAAGGSSTGLTDRQGAFRLRRSDLQDGAAPGWHRVTVQDLSLSTGVHRRDNGAVEAAVGLAAPPPPVRPSRVPAVYASLGQTPLRQEVKPGHQTLDLDIK